MNIRESIKYRLELWNSLGSYKVDSREFKKSILELGQEGIYTPDDIWQMKFIVDAIKLELNTLLNPRKTSCLDCPVLLDCNFLKQSGLNADSKESNNIKCHIRGTKGI